MELALGGLWWAGQPFRAALPSWRATLDDRAAAPAGRRARRTAASTSLNYRACSTYWESNESDRPQDLGFVPGRGRRRSHRPLPLSLTESSYLCAVPLSGGQRRNAATRAPAEFAASPRRDGRCGHAVQNWTI